MDFRSGCYNLYLTCSGYGLKLHPVFAFSPRKKFLCFRRAEGSIKNVLHVIFLPIKNMKPCNPLIWAENNRVVYYCIASTMKLTMVMMFAISLGAWLNKRRCFF